MPFKTILVQMDAEKRGERALSVALQLAQSHDAHLIGVGVKVPVFIPAYAAAQVPPEAFETFAKEQETAIADAKAKFDKTVNAADWSDRSAWRLAEGDIIDAMASAARLADLAVISQFQPGVDVAINEPLADSLVIEAGRPILIVPYIGARETVGERILVAWNNSRESARAVADAMPLLKAAKKVTVLSAADEDLEDVPGADVARYLAEHGVNAETTRAKSSDSEVGSLLLNVAADDGHDLLVMGAYGHSRLREMILGGASRYIIQHMTIPVLMSH